jgi:hypothetical protein
MDAGPRTNGVHGRPQLQLELQAPARHPHVEDNTAQNHYELLWFLYMMLRIPMNYYGCWTSSWHPGDADLNCFILMLSMLMVMLRMSILYILYMGRA